MKNFEERNLRVMPLWAASRAGNVDIFCYVQGLPPEKK
jgi:hypothetical protein